MLIIMRETIFRFVIKRCNKEGHYAKNSKYKKSVNPKILIKWCISSHMVYKQGKEVQIQQKKRKE